MKTTLRTFALLLGFAGASSAFGQSTIFSENMGSPSGTTTIASNIFQNSQNLAFSGSADIRITSASTGYTDASGGGNVFLTNSGTAWFMISGIDVSGYVAGSIDLSFGAFKSTTASNMTELVVEFSTNGTSFTALTIPSQATGTGTANWRLVNVDGASIPSTTSLYLRWTNISTGPQFRIDDVKLTGTPVPEPSAFAGVAGLAALGGAALRRSRRSASAA